MKFLMIGSFVAFVVFTPSLADPYVVNSSYSQIGVNPEHSFRAKVPAVVNGLYWRMPMTISRFSALLPFRMINDDFYDFVVFAAESSGHYVLYCLKDNGGFEFLWRTELPDSVTGFPAIDKFNQRIIVSAGDSLIAYGLNDGLRVWATNLPGRGWHPTIWHDFVFVADEAGYLSAYNLRDGSLRWRSDPLGGGLYNTTATVDPNGNVYIGTLANQVRYYDWRVYSFDSLGNQRWLQEYLAFEPGGIRMTMPLISAEKVIHHNFWQWGWQCGVYCVDSSGVRWRYGPIGLWSYYSSIAFDQSRGRLYLGTGDGLLTLDTLGNFVREFDIGSITYSSPLIDSLGNVLIGTDEGVFYVFNPDGQEVFQYETDDEFLGSPTIGLNGNIYVAGQSYLHCFSYIPGIEERKQTIPSQLKFSEKLYDLSGRSTSGCLRSGVYFRIKGGRISKVVVTR
jgi:hypothetical protein